MTSDSDPHVITNDDVHIYASHSVWDDVSTLISHIISISPSTSMSATFHDFGGCRTFPACIILSHRHDVSAAIDDAAHYGARTLAEGLGLDYSLTHSHINQVNSSGIVDFINTLSVERLGLTLHPRYEMILSPPPRIRSLSVNPIHSLSFTPSLEVVAAMQLHRSVIAPTITFTPPPSFLPILITTLANMLSNRPDDDSDYIILSVYGVHIFVQ
jgi:hypothetical protein